jgi:hypothetical protein
MTVGEINRRLKHMPLMLVASAALTAVAAAAGAIAEGGAGALGAAAGVALVAASFTVSSVVIAWADSINPALVMPVGLLTYALKIVILGVVLFGMVSLDWRGRVPLGFGVMAGVLLWTALQAWWTWRAKIPYVDV